MMKRKFILLGLLLAAGILMSSCKKDDEFIPDSEVEQLLKPEITPSDGSQDISPLADIIINFGHPIGKAIQYNGSSYVLEVTRISVSDNQGKKIIDIRGLSANIKGLSIDKVNGIIKMNGPLINDINLDESYTISVYLKINSLDYTFIKAKEYSSTFTTYKKADEGIYTKGIFSNSLTPTYNQNTNHYQLPFYTQPNISLNFPLEKPFTTDGGKHQFIIRLNTLSIKEDNRLIDASTSLNKDNKLFFIKEGNLFYDTNSIYDINTKLIAYEIINGEEKELFDRGYSLSNLKFSNQSIDIALSNPSEGSSGAPINQDISLEFTPSINLSNSLFDQLRPDFSSLKLTAGTQSVAFDTTLTSENIFKIHPHSALPKNTSIQIDGDYKIKFVGGTNEAYYQNGKVFSKSFSFQTGNWELEGLIKPEDIRLSYPVARQRNFLPKEFDKGIVKLSYISSDVTQYLNNNPTLSFIMESTGDSLNTSCSWNAQDSTFKFNIPQGIQNNTVYAFSIYENNTHTTLYKTYLKTSKYNTFSEKVSGDFNLTNVGWRYGYELGCTYYLNDEIIDLAEVNKLTKLVGVLDQTDYYTEYAYPKLYSFYNDLPFSLTWRNESLYGVPPSKAFLYRQYYNAELSNEEISNLSPNSQDLSYAFAFICHYGSIMKNDYDDLYHQAEYYNGDSNQYVDTLLTNGRDFPFLIKGLYPFKLQYVIPGYDVTTTEIDLQIKNPI